MAKYTTEEMMKDYWSLPNVVQKSLSNLTSRAISGNKIRVINALANVQKILLAESDFDLIRLEVQNLFDVREDPDYKSAIDVFGEKNVINVSFVSYGEDSFEYEKYSALQLEFNPQLWKLLSKKLPLFAKEFNVVINIGNSFWDDDGEDFHPDMSFQEWVWWVEREEVNDG